MPSRPKVVCRFCGRRGLRSREHIWPDWIGKRLPVRGSTTIVAWNRDRLPTAQKRIAFTSRLADVCEDCNTGWMRDIEEAARSVVTPMIFDAQPTEVPPDQQMVVASWVYLRSLVLQAAADAVQTHRRSEQPADQPTLARHWYEELARDRRPRSTCQIWLGALALPADRSPHGAVQVWRAGFQPETAVGRVA